MEGLFGQRRLGSRTDKLYFDHKIGSEMAFPGINVEVPSGPSICREKLRHLAAECDRSREVEIP